MPLPSITVVRGGRVTGDVTEESRQILLGAGRGDASPLQVGISRVPASTAGSLIRHDSAEVAYVVAGHGTMITDVGEHPFAPGDAILIETGAWHAIGTGAEAVTMLFVFPSAGGPATDTWPGERLSS